jgi:hypothetical protein
MPDLRIDRPKVSFSAPLPLRVVPSEQGPTT